MYAKILEAMDIKPNRIGQFVQKKGQTNYITGLDNPKTTIDKNKKSVENQFKIHKNQFEPIILLFLNKIFLQNKKIHMHKVHIQLDNI